MAGKSFFGRIMGRNQSETQAAVPMSQVNSAPQDDKTYEFNTRLGSSYLNVVNYGTKCTAPYSTEEITRMARDPMQYISELRQWAKWAYYSNGTVTTAIDSLVSLHSLDYVVVVKPKKAGGSRKGYRASMDKMTSVLRSMRYKEVIRDGLFHDANEGMYVGYMETRTVPVDDRLALTDLDIQGITEINSAGVNCVVISLPVEYTRIIGRRNNCYEVAFDLRYFSAMTEGDRKRKLQGFPRQIQEGWRRYSNGEFPDGACWQRLDWRKTIVTKIKSGQNDPYGVPFAVAALDDIDYAKYFIIATNKGVRMQAPDHGFTITNNGLFADEEISVGSDRRLKQAIEYRMDKYENFFMKLKPTQYQLKAGKSKRLHTGFIAQDVERALLESGLTTNDFAGLTITPVQEVNPKDGIDDVFYRLRYGEFISLNTYMIQTLYRRISELEEKIKSL